MPLDSLTIHSDVERARRTLVYFSISTLIFAGLEFGTDTLSILGLEILFDQAKTLMLLRIIVAFLMVVYLLHSAQSALTIFAKEQALAHKNWESSATQIIQEIESSKPDLDRPPFDPELDLDPWDYDFFARQRTARGKAKQASSPI